MAEEWAVFGKPVDRILFWWGLRVCFLIMRCGVDLIGEWP